MRLEVEKRYNLQTFGKMGRKINVTFSRDIFDTRDLKDLFEEVRDRALDEIEFLEREIEEHG